MVKLKIACISYTVRDRVISAKFLTHRVSKQDTLHSFEKNFPLSKNDSHFEFSTKMVKLKIACISLTMRGRAILAKVLAHRVHMQDTLLSSHKFFLFPKMAAILNF